MFVEHRAWRNTASRNQRSGVMLISDFRLLTSDLSLGRGKLQLMQPVIEVTAGQKILLSAMLYNSAVM